MTGARNPIDLHKFERGEDRRMAAPLFEYTVKGIASDVIGNGVMTLTVEADSGERIGLEIRLADCGYTCEEHFEVRRGPLLDLVETCGIGRLEDTEQFHGIPFKLFVRRFRDKDGLRIASAWGCRALSPSLH